MKNATRIVSTEEASIPDVKDVIKEPFRSREEKWTEIHTIKYNVFFKTKRWGFGVLGKSKLSNYFQK